MIICVFLLYSLSGCWDTRELDKLAIIVGIGIDRAERQGEILVTTQIVNPKLIGTSGNNSGGMAGKRAFSNMSGSGETIIDALSEVVSQTTRKLFFPHDKVIIFSRDAAMDGITEHIDFFVRNYKIRLNSLLLISECDTSEILDMETGIEEIPALAIADVKEIQEMASRTSVFRLYEFVLRLMSDTTAPVATYMDISEINGKKVCKVMGTAVFKGGNMVGTLTGDETRGFLWATGEVMKGKSGIRFPDSEHKTTVSILRSSSKTKAEIKDDKPIFKIEIECNIGVERLPAEVDLTLPETMEALEKAYEDEVKKSILSALSKARELDADIFGFGEKIHKKYPAKWEEMKGSWDELFKKAAIEITVKANLRETGTIINNIVKKQE